MRTPSRPITRREWLGAVAAGAVVLPAGGSAQWGATTPNDDLDAFIERTIRERKVAGLAAAVVKGDRLVWSRGYGWANVKAKVRMDPARTIQNIASTSKTVTATAVMQLVEQRKLGLDEDVNRWLPFPVRNPSHPDVAITVRQLLTHRSGIRDSDAYDRSYVCGDPTMSLAAWLEAYLTPKGSYYDAKENFQPWTPGEQGELKGANGRSYTNVGFGLLGFLVERASGTPFTRYCREHIFAPLGMTGTGWMLADVNQATHATPYESAESSDKAEIDQLQSLGFLGKTPERADATSTAFLPYCLYSFPNYPDGTVRTSVNELARFLMAYMNGGAIGGTRILSAETVAMMLSPQVASDPRRGLCWSRVELAGQTCWGHDGADPGVATMMNLRPTDHVGVIVFATTLSPAVREVSVRLFEEAARL